jgi:hypothetical protein
MRWLVICAGAALLLCGEALADSTPGDLSLTVYNSSLALVQDTRRLDVPAGRTRLEFKDVSAAIRPETVTLSGKGLSIVEQNFDYDLLTPAKMMEKMVGKQIRIVRTIPGTGKEITETATVLSVNDGVVLRIGNRIEALRDDGIPTRVVFDSIPENLRAQPTLSVTVDANGAGPRDATLSYLTTGLSWKADYVARFDEAQGTLALQGWITLTNTSGTTFKDAKTQLVAGDINLVSSEQEFWQREQTRSSSRSAGTGSPNQTSVADYLLYPLPDRVTIAENQTKQVGFLDASGIKAIKAYEYRSGFFQSQQDADHADVVLKFSNREHALPAGIARVYMRDEAGEPKFVGEDHLDHTPAGSDVAIKIGEAFDVTVQPTVTASEKLSKWRTRWSMSYAFRNAQPQPVQVELRQGGLERDGKVETESLSSKRIDASTLSWDVPVPANGETILTFTVDTGG